MDISNAYQSSNNQSSRQNAGGVFGYDIGAEKNRLSAGYDAVVKDLLVKWKKENANAQIFPAQIAAMHPEVVDFLLNFNLVAVYDNISKQVNLDAKGRNILPKIVWQIAQSKTWDGLDQVLEAELPLVHSAHVMAARLLQQNILDKVRVLSEKQIVAKIVTNEITTKKVQLALTEALLQYPKVGEQGITSDQIRLKYFPEPARPSVKNWITDFHNSMGAGKHSPIDRGNFLFHSENGKKLSSTDRQKLGTVLKSLDEQTLLTIDTDAQIILFENSVEETSIDSRPVMAARPQEPAPVVRTQAAPVWNDLSAERTPRESRPDINLRQNQNPASNQLPSPRRDVFFSSAHAAKVEMPQVEKRENKVPAFFMKPSEEVAKPLIASVPKPFVTPIKPVQAVQNVDTTHRDVSQENFFSIPQSKPPIGSERYDASEKKEEFVVEKISKPEPQSRPIANSTQIISGLSKSNDAVAKTVTNQDRNTMSDDDLFALLQEKKVVTDNVSFSSPQKLPAEQVGKIMQAAAPQPSQPKPSPFHITPSDYSYGKNTDNRGSIMPRVKGNVVDLS